MIKSGEPRVAKHDNPALFSGGGFVVNFAKRLNESTSFIKNRSNDFSDRRQTFCEQK